MNGSVYKLGQWGWRLDLDEMLYTPQASHYIQVVNH
jgi:hypothetical protein